MSIFSMNDYKRNNNIEFSNEMIDPDITGIMYENSEQDYGLTFDANESKLYISDKLILDDDKLDGKALLKNIGSLSGKDLSGKEGSISDGYHTFDELYNHRIALYLSLLAVLKNNPKVESWWSRKHHNNDGNPMFTGHVIVGLRHKDSGRQITYHMKADKYIPILKKIGVNELEESYEWDGHTPQDTVDRLHEWFLLGGQ